MKDNQRLIDLIQELYKPPPGTKIITKGAVQEGDWFYSHNLGAWGLVPEMGVGEPVTHYIIARGIPNQQDHLVAYE